PVVSLSSSCVPPRVIVFALLNAVLSKTMVSSPAVEFAWPTAQRRVPALPSSFVERTVNVDGQQRSSSASRASQARCGALRAVRVWAMGRANQLRIQDRRAMGSLLVKVVCLLYIEWRPSRARRRCAQALSGRVRETPDGAASLAALPQSSQ